MKKSFYAPLLLLAATAVHAQNDTIWIGYNDEVVEKQVAAYYKFIETKKPNGFEVTQYTTAHQLYSKGISSVKESPSIYQGTVIIFNRKGKPLTTFEYNKGVKEGTSVTTLTDGTKFLAEYRNNELFDGTEVSEFQDVYIALENREGVLTSAMLFDEAPNKFRQIIHFENGTISKEQTFDHNDALIASCTYAHFEVSDGKHIAFYHHPFQIKSVSDYADQALIQKTTYFRTGETKEIQTLEGETQVLTHYDKSGKELGTYRERTDLENYVTVREGINIIYSLEAGKDDQIESIYTYQDDELASLQEYDLEGVLKKVTLYRENYYPIKTTYYDKKGQQESQLTYSEYGEPFDGTEKQENGSRIFKNGQLVSETKHYSSGEVFQKSANFKTVYLDKKGKQIGAATYDTNTDYTSYSTPIEGEVLTLTAADFIATSATYKKGQLVNSTTFVNYRGKAVKQMETSYNENGYQIAEIKYHPNGQVFSQSEYANYSPTTTAVFDDKGKLLGKFDHLQMDGTLYSFFDSTNDIESISKYQKGALLYKKTFYKNDTFFDFNAKIYLESEIDFNKEGLFYEKNELISKATYKDGKPFEGKTVIRDEYASKIVTHYENGEKEGEEITYSIYSDEISTRNFYHLGKKVFTENYENNLVINRIPLENDRYNGEAIYFDSEGKEISRLTYKDDEPFEGTLISIDGENSIRTKTYKNGYIAESKMEVDGQLKYTRTLLDEDKQRYQVRSFSDTGLPRYDFKTLAENLDGEVLFYNEKGKIQNKARVQDGELISGTISLLLQDYNYNYDSHIAVTKKGQNYKIKAYRNEGNSLMYESSIKVIDKKDAVKPLPVVTPLTLESLYPHVSDFELYLY
ncbi:hypothetical protein [Flavobacterium sp. JP2137]|uniref:hypothetical protein n=1 Tax=Flavobacterium sp. JP2137 TaxID=3414510 RepID=UPI003D2FCEA7